MDILFAIVAVTVMVYVAALIIVGVYGAIRRKGGRDYFVSDSAKLAAVVAFALLSTIPTDILTMFWLRVVRNFVEVSANLNLFAFAVAPVVAVIVGAQALVLARVYRPRPLRHGALFIASYMIAHAAWLNLLFNPTADIVGHAATILIIGSLVLLLMARFVWRR